MAGASKGRIILQHIVPNVLNTWLVLASLTVGVVIIAEASLSFLGVGVPAPTPAWGSMLTEGRSALITRRPHLIYGPALLIGLTVLATKLVWRLASGESSTPGRGISDGAGDSDAVTAQTHRAKPASKTSEPNH